MPFLTQEELKRLFAVIKDKRDKALFLQVVSDNQPPAR
jgi:hypothetical protein